MKILITTDWYRPVINGVVTSVLNLERELRARGHEVRVLTVSRTHSSWKEDNTWYYLASYPLDKLYPCLLYTSSRGPASVPGLSQLRGAALQQRVPQLPENRGRLV